MPAQPVIVSGHHAVGFRSVDEEVDVHPPVEGDLPSWLSGRLVRNGPAVFETDRAAVEHWFDGLAMLRVFDFGDGGVRFRTRLLETDVYRDARDGALEGGFASGRTSLFGRLKTFLLEAPYDNANVTVERLGDRHVALTETPRWVEYDPATLSTRGHVRYDGAAPAGQLVCAHLKHDPATGRLVNFDTEFGRTSAYHIYELAGPDERDHVGSIPVQEPAYMHSFALTPRYVVLTEFPFVIDPMELLHPLRRQPFLDFYEWRPERGTRVLVLDRETGEVVADPTVGSCFGYHHVNAFEDGDEIVFDLETVPEPSSLRGFDLESLRSDSLEVPTATLERFRLEPATGTVDRRSLYEGSFGFPTASPAQRLSAHDAVYAARSPDGDGWYRTVIRVDVGGGNGINEYDPGAYVSEPLFVPAPDRATADDGVVLVVLLHPGAERSSLAVLDAPTMTERARIPLPLALPFGFHGRFFQSASGRDSQAGIDGFSA